MSSAVLKRAVEGWCAKAGSVEVFGVDRFSDRIALGVLTRAFPPELVDEAVAECGRVEQRTRLLLDPRG